MTSYVRNVKFKFFFKSEDQVQSFLDAKKKEYADINSMCPPLIIAIGTPSNIEKTLVCIEGIRYDCATPLKAVDVCFKAFWGFGCEYPLISRMPWTFIEHYVYGMTETKVPSKVAELHVDIERMK